MTIIIRLELKRAPAASMQGDSTIVTVIAVYCQQGAARTPTLSSGRCLFIFLLLSSIMIYNYYTSVLVSGLVGSSSKTNIKNVYDLANSKLNVGFDNVPYIKGFLTVCHWIHLFRRFFHFFFLSNLQTTTEPQFRYFIQRKLNNSGKGEISSFLMDTHDGFSRVQRGGFAFHCEASTAYPIISTTFESNEICDVNEVPFRTNPKNQGIIVRKGSPFLNLISTRFFWMRETGVLSKHERHWVAEKPACLSNVLLTSVGFDYTAPLFFFLIIAYIISLIILILENIFYYYTKKKVGRRH